MRQEEPWWVWSTESPEIGIYGSNLAPMEIRLA